MWNIYYDVVEFLSQSGIFLLFILFQLLSSRTRMPGLKLMILLNPYVLNKTRIFKLVNKSSCNVHILSLLRMPGNLLVVQHCNSCQCFLKAFLKQCRAFYNNNQSSSFYFSALQLEGSSLDKNKARQSKIEIKEMIKNTCQGY